MRTSIARRSRLGEIKAARELIENTVDRGTDYRSCPGTLTMTGNVAAVQAAVDAGAQVVGQKGMLVNKVVIPHPRPELLTEMI